MTTNETDGRRSPASSDIMRIGILSVGGTDAAPQPCRPSRFALSAGSSRPGSRMPGPRREITMPDTLELQRLGNRVRQPF